MSTTVPVWRFLAALLLGLTTSCAPLATFRPISTLMDDKTHEIGLGAVTVSPRPYVEEPWRQAGQFWVTTRATPWLNLTAISAFDAQALGVGIGASARLLSGHYFVAGLETEAGYGWAAGGIAFAGRLFERNWVYSAPRVSNFGAYPAVGLPVGLSLHVAENAFLRLEYQASWTNFQAYELRHHFGSALAVEW